MKQTVHTPFLHRHRFAPIYTAVLFTTASCLPAQAENKSMPMYETYDYSIAIGHDDTIVGSSNKDGKTLTSWSFEGGRYGSGAMTDIPDTTQEDRMTVRGVSNGGNVIVGQRGSSVLYWKKGDGYQTITSKNGSAFGVSSDGTAVAGSVNKTTPGQYEAFRWAEGPLGFEILNMPAKTVSSEAKGISADGKVIAGTFRGTDNSSIKAFRWKDGNTADLGNPSTSGYFMGVNAISGDGNVIVGYGQTGTAGKKGEFGVWDAFRWTDGASFTFLPTMPGFEQHVANAASYDGSVIVGAASDVDYSELTQHRA